MPCYRCGTRQVDPVPGKPSSWHRGLVGEHQVLICPGCCQAALADLTRCGNCESAHQIRRLDQVECLDCRLTRVVLAEDGDAQPPSRGGSGGDSGLAAEVARALERLRGTL